MGYLLTSRNFLFFCTVLALVGHTVVDSAEFLPPEPSSEFLTDLENGLDSAFCAAWDPDFNYKGNLCCAAIAKRRGIKCTPKRSKKSFCDEMTEEQKQYIRKAEAGELDDLLSSIAQDVRNGSQQAHCSPNNGFLSNGRPLIDNEMNRIQIRRKDRCVHFGTDPMIGMLEWLGRQVHQKYNASEYSEVRLLVGDISAPRGGCLAGRGGRRGHSSHTTGQDMDIGFLTSWKNKPSPGYFHQKLNAEENWWLLKKIFENPFACIRAVFLDKRLIRKLHAVAQDDPDWDRYRNYIKHVRYHKNHFHIRIGDGPGLPGCDAEWVTLKKE